MASPVVNSKIFNPFMPSLSHLALVKVALPLYKEYGSEMLSKIMKSIHHEISTPTNTHIQENIEEGYIKAKEALLFIPAHLREKVLATVYGIEYEVTNWQLDHFYLRKIFGDSMSLYKYIFYWRSDGTIDTIKTAQELVLNENFHIRKRFQIACVYCFVNNVQTLWAEMEASGIAERSYLNIPDIEDVWIKWIRNGTRVHWTEAILEEDFKPIRFSCFFSLLQPEARQKFLSFIYPGSSLSGRIHDDLRQCLQAMRKEEEEQVMRMNGLEILRMFLKWPLNTVFLEQAGKMFNYISYKDSRIILLDIYRLRFREDSDYRVIFEGFWNMAPDDHKANWRELPILSDKIDNYFVEKRLAQKLIKISI